MDTNSSLKLTHFLGFPLKYDIYECVCVIVHMWSSEDNLHVLFLSTHFVGSGDCSHGIRFPCGAESFCWPMYCNLLTTISQFFGFVLI